MVSLGKQIRSAFYKLHKCFGFTIVENMKTKTWLRCFLGALGISLLGGYAEYAVEAQPAVSPNPVVSQEVAKGVVVQVYQKLDATKLHTAGVGASLFSPDGRHVITRKENKLHLVEVQTGAVSVTLDADMKAHWNGHWSATYSPDGKQVAALIKKDKQQTAHIELFDAKTGAVQFQLFPPRTSQGEKHVLDVTGRLSFSSDGKRLAVLGGEDFLRVWDVTSRTFLHEEEGSRWDSWSHGLPLLFAHDTGEIIRVDHEQKRIQFLQIDASEGKTPGVSKRLLPAEPALEKNPALLTSFSPSGQQFLLGLPNKVLVGNSQTGERQLEVLFPSHVHTAAYSADEQRLAIAYGNNSLLVLDAKTGALVKQWDTQPLRDSVKLEKISQLALSPHGKTLITYTENQQFGGRPVYYVTQVWEAETGNLLATWPQQAPAFSEASLSPDGKRVVAALDDNTFRMWDVATGRLMFTKSGGASHFSRMKFSPDGKRVITDGDEGVVRGWNAQDGALLFTLVDKEGAQVQFNEISLDGTQITTLLNTSSDSYFPVQAGRIDFWSASTGEKLATTVPLTDKSAYRPKFSPDGTRHAWIALDPRSESINVLKVVDHMGGKPLVLIGAREMMEQRKSIEAFSFSPDSSQIVTRAADCEVRFWDAKTGALINKFEQTGCRGFGEPDPMYSGDGERLALVYENNVEIRKRNGSLEATLSLSERARSLAFLSNERMLVVVGKQMQVFQKGLFSAWKKAWSKSLPSPGEEEDKPNVTVSKDGSTLLVRASKSLQIFNSDTGALIQTISMPTS